MPCPSNTPSATVNGWSRQGYQDISENFRIDSGFLTRTGMHRLAGLVLYQMYPKSKFFQKIDTFYWGYHLYDTAYEMFESLNLAVLRFSLPRSTQVRFEGFFGNEVYAGERFSRNGIGVRSSSQIVKELFLQFFFRRLGSIYYDPADPLQGVGNTVSGASCFSPWNKLNFVLSLTYVDFFLDSTGEKLYDYTLVRSRNTLQINKYLFLRAIFEYNFFRERLTADLLASFTYIPGTVIHIGYGSAYQRLDWDGTNYIESDRFMETLRGFFFKVSYLWRF